MWLILQLTSLIAFAAPTLQFWHSMTGEKGKLVQEMVDEFNQKGGVQVKTQFVGTYEEGLNKTRTAILARQEPHIVQIAELGTQTMLDTKAVEPVESAVDKKLLLPQLRSYYEVGGKLQALPFATSNPILYYNKDAFQKAGIKEAPKTWEELKKVAEKLTDPKAKTFGITWPLHCWFFEQLLAVQGELLVLPQNGRGAQVSESNLTSPAALEVVTLWKDLVEKGHFANVGRGWEPAQQSFLAGRSQMLITSTSDVFEIQKRASFQVGTGFLPMKDSKQKGGTIIGGNALWLLKNKSEAEKKGAADFLNWMLTPQMQKKWHLGTGYFPVRADVIAQLEKEGIYQKYPNAKTAINQLKAAPATASSQGALIGVFPELRENVSDAIEKVLTQKVAVNEAMGRAKTKTDEAIRRWQKTRSH